MLRFIILLSVFLTVACEESGNNKPLAPVTSGSADIPDSELTTTASGLQYKILKKGDSGKKPTAENTVAVHYEGKLLNGKIFDSSYERGQPAAFPLGRVIPGWTEGVQLMDKGAIFLFKIPPELAYGPTGAGEDIPPDSPLIFKIELIDFK